MHNVLLYCSSTWFVCATAGGRSGFTHSVPARVAVNMIMCCASGGSLAVVIACWAQVRRREAGVGMEEDVCQSPLSLDAQPYTCTHTHKNAYVHSCTHTHMYTYIYPHIHTYTHAPIPTCSQVKYHAATVNANEVANGVISCLVAITSSCAILEYYEACIVGGT